MAGKLGLLIGFGAGYVLGARAGRERYDQIASTFRKARQDPRVEAVTDQAMAVAAEQARHARDAAAHAAAQATAAAKEKASGAVDKAKEQVGRDQATDTPPPPGAGGPSH